MKLVVPFLALLSLSACALSVDHITVPYEGGGSLGSAAGAEKAVVAVSAVDARLKNRDRVGVKKNGYGMEMANIVADNDVVKTTGDAVQKELAALGYRIGDDGAQVVVDVVRFQNDFKTGFLSGDAVAEVSMNVRVLGRDKAVTLSKLYEAEGLEDGIQLASGENARAALVKALRNAVQKVVTDLDLQQAIIRAQPAAVAEKGPPTS